MMSEKLKTIKELADELGVSKQNLQYHVKFLPTKKRQKNESGIVVLNIEEQMFISGRIKKNITKYLKKAIEQYLPTVKRQDL